MKALTYTSYKRHCDLCTESHGSITVKSCQMELPQKDIILLSEISIVVYKASKRTSVENTKFISFNLSAGTYSIDDFNVKIKVAILQKRQDWEPPKIKDLRLVIPEDYTFMASNTIFIALVIQDNYLEKAMRESGQFYPLAHTKHLLIHNLLQYHCHCTASKSTKSKPSCMDNYQVCWPSCIFLIVKQLFIQSI